MLIFSIHADKTKVCLLILSVIIILKNGLNMYITVAAFELC